MTNIDMLKARRFRAAAEDARELIRGMRARCVEGREDAARAQGRIYFGRPELLAVSLEDLLSWTDDDLWHASITRGEVRAAIEARNYAVDLDARLAAAVAANAPCIALGARVTEYLNQHGVQLL